MTVSPGTTSIGFIGLGIMGKSMARNIIKAGFKLSVHNRSPQSVKELVSEGARDGGSPAGVAAVSDIIFTSLPDTPDVEKVLFGPNGAAQGARAGAVVIDCSTISATAAAEFARQLKERGIDMLDCPVSGGPKGAETGSLSCMIGGEESVVQRCMPALQAIGRNFIHAGPAGAGQGIKACNQLVICATLMGISEAIALCKKIGIDPEKMREALSGGAADSFVLQNHAKRLLAETLQPGFRAALMLKDMKLASSAGWDTGTFMPVASLSTQMLSALCQTGREGLDSAAVGLVFQELSGLR